MARASLIIGNGFDLNVGVKSSFSNFFESEILKNGRLTKPNNIIYNIIYCSFYDYDNGFGYPIFNPIYKKDPLWMDVEHLLMDIAIGNASNSKSYKDILYCAYIGVNDSSLSKYLDSNQLRLFIKVLSSKKEKYGNRNNDVINDIFYDDLMEFEKDFVQYLSSILNSSYDTKSLCLFKRIAEKTGTFYNIDQVISFNYTRSNKEKLKNIFKEFYTFVNIHGDLKSNNAVIGYDADMHENDLKSIYSLSKGWQRIRVQYSSIATSSRENDVFVFYGHSLGEQDYAQLFTYIDSRQSDINKISFIFCYSYFSEDETKNKKNESYYLMAITRFINAYDYYRTKNKNGLLYNSLLAHGRLKFMKIDYPKAIFRKDSSNISEHNFDYSLSLLDETTISVNMIVYGLGNKIDSFTYSVNDGLASAILDVLFELNVHDINIDDIALKEELEVLSKSRNYPINIIK